MAYDLYLADRIKQILKDRGVESIEKPMMGGLVFMVDDKMCLGISNNNLMARVGTEIYEEALQMKGARKMNITGKSMKGYIFVDPIGYDMDSDLEYWIQICLDHNPLARSSKNKE